MQLCSPRPVNLLRRPNFNIKGTNLAAALGGAGSGLLGAVIDSSRIATYFVGGTRINYNLGLGLILFIPASFLGAKVAKEVVNKIPQQNFRIVVAAFLLVIGVKLLFFP